MIGTIIGDKYRITQEIGRGGMSVVYLAMDTRLDNKIWAVKQYRQLEDPRKNEINRRSLLAEADLMKRLDHPTLPRIVDIIEKEGSLFIVMDYIEGRSLDKELRDRPAEVPYFAESQVLKWAMQLCDALQYLHGRKPCVIYRDMKPANVMLKPDGMVKIVDFGIAREFVSDSAQDTSLLVSQGYAAPEQLAGHSEPRSDIYALGKTMFQLLTGKSPQQYRPIRSIRPEISEGTEQIIARCVRDVAEERYANCGELLFDLQHPELLTKEHRRKRRRNLRLFAMSVGCSMALFIGGVSCRLIGVDMKNGAYDTLISPSRSADLDTKLASYRQAVTVYPERTEAYEKILEAYQDESVFTRQENQQFLALYDANKEVIDRNGEAYDLLNYHIGMMYFNYYSHDDGTFQFSERVQKAFSFFQEVHERSKWAEDDAFSTAQDESGWRVTAECYYQICDFYKTYILTTTTIEEVSVEDYEELFDSMEAAVNQMESANAYDQLCLYSGIFRLIYDQRETLAQVHTDEDRVIDFLNLICRKAEGLTVQKEQTRSLQEEIENNETVYREAVQRAYANRRRYLQLNERR